MARITVEDCTTKVTNRFELILIAAHRARQLSLGNEALIDRDGDKNSIIALREIGDGAINPANLMESLANYIADPKSLRVEETGDDGLLSDLNDVVISEHDEDEGDDDISE